MADIEHNPEVSPTDFPDATHEEALRAKREDREVSEEEQSLVAQWNSRRETAGTFCRPYFLHAREMIAYYLGFQWLLRAPNNDPSSAGYWIKERRRPEHIPWDVQLTVNLFSQHVSARRARILLDEPTAAVCPATEDDDSIKRAAIAQQFCDAFDAEWDSQRHYQTLLTAVVAAGLGWMVDSWDSEALTQLEMDGEPVRSPSGAATTTLAPPWSVFWEAGSSVRDASYYIRDIPMTLDEVRERWPDVGDYVAPEQDGEHGDGVSGRGMDEDRVSSSLLRFMGESGSDPAEPGKRWVTVHEGYERLGFGDWASWRCVTWCQDVVLDAATMPWQPLVPFVFDEIVGYPYPIGLGKSLKEVQDRINVLWSKIHKHFNLMTNPKILKHIGTVIEDGALSDKPGEHVEWAGDVAPEYMAMPPLNREVYEELSRLMSLMGELSGVHEVSQAKLPSASLSGRAVGLLQEQDSTNAQHTVANWKAALRKHYRNLISIAEQHYDAPRWLDVVGEDTELDVSSFVGSDLAGVGDVRLRVGTAIPLMPRERRQLVNEMQVAGLNAPGREVERARYLEQLGMGAPEQSPTLVMSGRKAARREHSLLEREHRIPPPMEFEPHGIHLEEHEKYMQSATFQHLAPIDQETMRNHWETTRLLGVATAVRATQEEMLIQSGGMPTGPTELPSPEQPGVTPGAAGPV